MNRKDADRIRRGEGEAVVLRSKVILGVDPGLARAGWGVIDVSRPALSLVGYGAIQTKPADGHAARLLRIFEEIREVIEKHQAPMMAIEEVFQGKSARSAMLLGEGRAACLLAAATQGVPVAEYPATAVKVSLTGNGRAAKQQVQSMVHRLLNLETPPRPYDAADALAVAITHWQRSRIAGFSRPRPVRGRGGPGSV